MKYSIECSVLSNIWIGRTVSFLELEKEYIFRCNEKGILNSIKITKKLKNPDKFYSETDSTTSPIQILMKEDPDIRQEMISEFQYLEAHIGLIANLTKIFWNEPWTEWIPETDEERNKTKVLSAHFERASPPPTVLNANVLKRIINDRPIKNDLTILMSFCREGKVFFDRLEFINAFYDFYFVLEDLYGKGCWKNMEVKDNFKSSIELQDTIKWVLSELIDSSDKHKKEILALLQQKNLQYSPEGISILLVEMRGHLHHFSRKTTIKQKPSPIAHLNYESLAFLSMAIAVQSILKEMNEAIL